VNINTLVELDLSPTGCVILIVKRGNKIRKKWLGNAITHYPALYFNLCRDDFTNNQTRLELWSSWIGLKKSLEELLREQRELNGRAI
jgi:hypothetical protein